MLTKQRSMVFSRTIPKDTKTIHTPGSNNNHTRLWPHVARVIRNNVSCHSSNQPLKNQRSNDPAYTSDKEKGQSTSATPQGSAASKYAMCTEDLFHCILRPYIVGSAPNSTLIKITNISNIQQLKTLFASLSQGNNYHFYSALQQERKYL